MLENKFVLCLLRFRVAATQQGHQRLQRHNNLLKLLLLLVNPAYSGHSAQTVTQGCTNCGSLAAWLQENGERIRKGREKEEMERKWKENEEMERE